MPSKLPSFSLHAQDWLTKTREFPWGAKGILMELLALCWENGSIPADPQELARILHLEQRKMDAVWVHLRECFTDVGAPGGRLISRRLERDRAEQHAYREMQKNKAARGASLRAKIDAQVSMIPHLDTSRGTSQTTATAEPRHMPDKVGVCISGSEASSERRDPEEAQRLLGVERFLELYQLYPRHEGKQRGIAKCLRTIRSARALAALERAVRNYVEKVRVEQIEQRFVMHFSTFMGCWQDYVDYKPQPAPVQDKHGRPVKQPPKADPSEWLLRPEDDDPNFVPPPFPEGADVIPIDAARKAVDRG